MNLNRSYEVNGLNQYTSAGGISFGYDGRGNLTSSGGTSYGYTSENQLATATGITGLAYDALGRLFNSNAESGTNVTFAYDGYRVAAELNQSTGAVLRRYVYGPGVDEPLVWYEGPGAVDKRWLVADERGSVVAITNPSGDAIDLKSYDEFGIPSDTTPVNAGRFGYTGQAWLPSLGMWYYKARMYSATLGRFLQTDPIGYADGLNWYNYVGSDPVNRSDPSGLQETIGAEVIVNGVPYKSGGYSGSGDNLGAGGTSFIPRPVTNADKGLLQTIGLWPTPTDTAPQNGIEVGADAEIVVTAKLPSCGLLCRVGRALGIGRVGAQGEAAVRAQFDIGPKVMINVDGQVRFPDALNDTTLSEVKNVARLSYTSQLRSYVTYSQRNGLQFDLYVRSSTRLSAPLLGLQSQGVIRITNIPGM